MSEMPKFHDPALREAAQRTGPQLENFQNTLDQTSSDIKALEKWLQECGIRIYTSVGVKPGANIAWSDAAGDWRLVFEVLEEDLPYESYDSKPLIETPARTRLECRQYLPYLVREISSILPEATPSKTKAAVSGKRTKEDDLDAIFAEDDKLPF